MKNKIPIGTDASGNAMFLTEKDDTKDDILDNEEIPLDVWRDIQEELDNEDRERNK